MWCANWVKCSTRTFTYLWPNESVQPLNGFIVVYYSIHPIHIQHNLAQSYRKEENKKQGDIMVLHVNIIFNHHNASCDFLILSTQYVKNQNWREFLGSEIIKILFQRKSVDHSRRNKGYSGHLEDAIKASNQWLLFLCALMYKYMFLCFYICV